MSSGQCVQCLKERQTVLNNLRAGTPTLQHPVHKDHLVDAKAFLDALLHRDERAVAMLKLWAAGR